MTHIKFIKKETKEPDSLALFFQFPQNQYFLAHLYEHLIERSIKKIKDIETIKATTEPNFLTLIISTNKTSNIDLKFFLLENTKSSDIENEKRRLILEMLTEINEHRWIVHNLVRYQKRNIILLKRYLEKMEKKQITKKDLLSFLNLSDAFVYSNNTHLKKIKKEINTLGKVFKSDIPKRKNTKMPQTINSTPSELVYPSITTIIPIKSEMEAYKLVFASRIIKEEIEEELIKRGLIYSSRLELTKDFTNRIFVTTIFPSQANSIDEIIEIAQKKIIKLPKRKKTFNLLKNKLLDELKIKSENKFKEEIDKIEQILEWEIKNPITIKEKISLIKNLDINDLSNWWKRKIKKIKPTVLNYNV